MPEGDTVWAAAQRLDKALAGKTLVRSDFRVARFATVDLAGQEVTEVLSRGKHLLIRVGTGASALTVHSHLKMEGAWHLYVAGDKWRRPAFTARVILQTAQVSAVGFSLAQVEVVARDEEHRLVGYLGPDLLGSDWDATEALLRLRSDPARPIGTALLDQRNLAGIGNVFRNDLCFLAGIHPSAPVAAVPRLERLVDTAKRLLEANKRRSARITTGLEVRGQADRLWVHGRDRQPCRRCGTLIERGRLGNTALDERDIYFCPHCQPLPAAAEPADSPPDPTERPDAE